MMAVQMDMPHQIALVNDDRPMYEKAFAHIEFLFVHRFLMSREKFFVFDDVQGISYHKSGSIIE